MVWQPDSVCVQCNNDRIRILQVLNPYNLNMQNRNSDYLTVEFFLSLFLDFSNSHKMEIAWEI